MILLLAILLRVAVLTSMATSFVRRSVTFWRRWASAQVEVAEATVTLLRAMEERVRAGGP